MKKLLLAMCLGLVIPTSFAMRGNAEDCINFATFAQDATQLRDQGITWEQFEAWLNSALEQALANPAYSYVKTPEEAAFIHTQMQEVWELKKDGGEVFVETYEACMK